MSVDISATLVYGVVLESSTQDVYNLPLEESGLSLEMACSGGDITFVIGVKTSCTSTSRLTSLALAKLVRGPEWNHLLRSACEKYGLKCEGDPGWLLLCCRL